MYIYLGSKIIFTVRHVVKVLKPMAYKILEINSCLKSYYVTILNIYP